MNCHLKVALKAAVSKVAITFNPIGFLAPKPS